MFWSRKNVSALSNVRTNTLIFNSCCCFTNYIQTSALKWVSWKNIDVFCVWQFLSKSAKCVHMYWCVTVNEKWQYNAQWTYFDCSFIQISIQDRTKSSHLLFWNRLFSKFQPMDNNSTIWWINLANAKTLAVEILPLCYFYSLCFAYLCACAPITVVTRIRGMKKN